MTGDEMKAAAVRVIEEAFNKGNLDVIDDSMVIGAVDHQEAPGTEFREHLKWAVTALRTAFPDLHFDVHQVIAEGDIVAFRSTMTGTQHGPLNIGPMRMPPTGRRVEVPHMHFLRMEGDKTTDLWHLWDTPAMMRQLGAAPPVAAPPVAVPA